MHPIFPDALEDLRQEAKIMLRPENVELDVVQGCRGATGCGREAELGDDQRHLVRVPEVVELSPDIDGCCVHYILLVISLIPAVGRYFRRTDALWVMRVAHIVRRASRNISYNGGNNWSHI